MGWKVLAKIISLLGNSRNTAFRSESHLPGTWTCRLIGALPDDITLHCSKNWGSFNFFFSWRSGHTKVFYAALMSVWMWSERAPDSCLQATLAQVPSKKPPLTLLLLKTLYHQHQSSPGLSPGTDSLWRTYRSRYSWHHSTRGQATTRWWGLSLSLQFLTASGYGLAMVGGTVGESRQLHVAAKFLFSQVKLKFPSHIYALLITFAFQI